MKVEINYRTTSATKELSMFYKVEQNDNAKTCISNLTHIIPFNEFELYQTKEDQIILYDLKNNITHDSTDFCIDTQFDTFFNSSETVAKVCHSLCANESSACVQFCCPRGKFAQGIFGKCVLYNSTDDNSDWKPKALIDAEEQGLGRALYDTLPSCVDSFNIDSYKTNHPLDVLENGNLDWGKDLYIENNSSRLIF